MADLYLQAMMNGPVRHKKDKYDEAMEREIKLYLDSLLVEEGAVGSQLVTANMKRARLLEELKEKLKMVELAEHIKSAFSFIRSEGLQYLEPAIHEKLLLEFQNAAKLLEEFDLTQEMPNNFQEMLAISDDAMEIIYRIGTAAYMEGRWQSSLSVFVLLATLNQSYPEYWFRVGIAAQKNDHLDLALKAYAMTSSMSPELIGPRLFAAECLLANGSTMEAMEQLKEAKKIKEKSDVEPVWLDLLSSLEKELEIKVA